MRAGCVAWRQKGHGRRNVGFRTSAIIVGFCRRVRRTGWLVVDSTCSQRLESVRPPGGEGDVRVHDRFLGHGAADGAVGELPPKRAGRDAIRVQADPAVGEHEQHGRRVARHPAEEATRLREGVRQGGKEAVPGGGCSGEVWRGRIATGGDVEGRTRVVTEACDGGHFGRCG